ncbi:spore germination protein [Paenibacillus glycanilyticus]|uniref:GerAB/ArcD/ProY family transporter n=1 Tax=Paenibacillus glycanilyticus TaxID=126569 RepID=UPI002041A604|nr:endospore germination permease [Paenibacillus glycanilyticus]MCM3627063.1 spore germination protein [Paenibacillus glycanilyticus]
MKLSLNQLFWLLTTMEIGMTALLTIGESFKESRQAAWLSILLALLSSLVVTYISSKLCLLFPGKTFVDFVPELIGKWLGKLLSILYLAIWYAVGGVILREYSDFVHMALFLNTPIWVIMVLMILMMIYTVTGGVQTLGRCSEIIGPFITISIVLITLLLAKDFRPVMLLPVLPLQGLGALVKGSLGAFSFLGESIAILMLIGFLQPHRKITAAATGGVALAGILLILITVSTCMVLGPVLPTYFIYPVYSVVQYVSVMEFIQNIDVLAVIVVIFSIFIKLSLYLFITSYGTAKVLGITKWRNITGASAILFLIIALYPKNIIESQVYFPDFWKYIVLPIFIISIPLLLLVIGMLRRRAGKLTGQ